MSAAGMMLSRVRAGALAALGVLLAAAVASAEDPAGAPPPPPLPEKVAQVGQYIITGEEFQRDLAIRVRQLSSRSGRPVIPDTEFRQETLRARIDAVVLQQLAESSVSVDDAAVEKEFARARAGFASENRFQEWMARMKTTAESLRAEIRARLAIRAFTEQKTSGVSVTDAEIRANYDELEKGGLMRRSDRTADLCHIVVSKKGDAPEDSDHARKRAEEARQRILAGEPFEQVAREVSEDPGVTEHGGRYLEASQSSLPPFITNRMFTQPVGELPEPFEAGNGWHLLRVDAVNEPGTVPYEKAAGRLRDALLAKKRQAVLEGLVDAARKVTHIEVFAAGLTTDVKPPLPKKEPTP